jgi:hypothetical protein
MEMNDCITLLGSLVVLCGTKCRVRLKAGLEYNEGVHRPMKIFKPKTRLFEVTVGMVDKMKNNFHLMFFEKM